MSVFSSRYGIVVYTVCLLQYAWKLSKISYPKITATFLESTFILVDVFDV
ncbi:hypothetical protein NIES2134_107680 [Thermostichus vulcanus NIES-2134]|nr:hypothetical protein NIES2134_107680 [Thermostichus vulcanus NIES-2134]